MMTIVHMVTPVVVLRSIDHGGLGIFRSLGRLGIPVYNVHSNPLAPAFFSRYCRGKFFWDKDASDEKSLINLVNVGRTIGKRSILIPTTDYAALFVADHADVLKEWFIFANQSAELVHSLYNKKEMFYLAKKLGIPTAETTFPQGREDVSTFLRHANFPIMLKGIDGELLSERAGQKMFIVRNTRELFEKYSQIEDPENPNLMLQEYIPGGDDTVWMFNGYFNQESECLFGLTGKKIRQFPPYRGSTSLGICLKNETVEKTTKEFMKAIDYKGILDIGYRYDARDGMYKVLDINPRIGVTFRLFVDDRGMDVARALYLDLTGQPVIPGVPREGRKWFVEDLDLISCLRYLRDRKLTLKEWIRSFRGVEESAFFAPDDLLPALVICLSDIREIAMRLYDKARRLATRAMFTHSPRSSDLAKI